MQNGEGGRSLAIENEMEIVILKQNTNLFSGSWVGGGNQSWFKGMLCADQKCESKLYEATSNYKPSLKIYKL